MIKVYIALGSNISPRHQHLKNAVNDLSQLENVEVIASSSVYETEPVGFTDQNDFLNMVVEVNTTLSAEQLLEKCQEIEQGLGRKRIVRWGPRTIDLDILLYNHENIETEHLIVPHPRMHERAFVLIPLIQLNDQVKLPSGKSLKAKLDQLPKREREGVKVWNPKNGEDESVHFES